MFMTTAKIISEKEWVNKNPKHSGRTYKLDKSKQLDIYALVKSAAKCIAPVWPLETFIACNPLQGFESQTFEQALAQGCFKRKKTVQNRALEYVNIQMIKWCGGFFDAGQGSIEMPHREQGFYYGFLKLAYFDNQLHQNKKESKDFLRQLPESSEEAIRACLSRLEVPYGKEESFIAETLLHLPGWAGLVKWKTDWNNLHATEEKGITLLDFLAVRLVITSLLWPDAAKEKKSPEDGSLVKEIVSQLKSSEDTYRQKLLIQLLPGLNKDEKNTKRRDAQLVFCIDVRSEPFRRVLESLGNYETFGFAGFFGIPVSVKEFETNKTKACCPVLLKPEFEVEQTPLVKDNYGLERYSNGKKFIHTLKSLYNQLKHNFSTPFALVESLGVWCGVSMILKTLAPHTAKGLTKSANNWLAPNVPTKVAYELNELDLKQGLSLKEQITYAATMLRLIGLTSDFAKLIILCGHGSTTENNPYASALDCGACGGNHGGINAQLLASILNKPEVRRGLEDHGIHIPLDTIVYGALHNTTTDVIEMYSHEGPKSIYKNLFKQLEDDLKQARLLTNLERGMKLNSDNPSKDIIRRSVDWSETRPEWGLAKNAAFIVAPRKLTKNIHLDGRCFLHSYRWEQDQDGSLLETILTAPMVVAEWINTQYLFSTLDNVAFGSGSKITHNVVGKIGIMQGNGSDLMHGLPLQSVMSSDSELYHEPQRLLAVVYAPKAMVLKVIEKHNILKTLFFNEWVHLLVIDPIDQMPYRLDKSGAWT